jgi:hypothetical protein
VAHACNPSYLGGWGWEDWDLRPAGANSLQDLISKITRTKWTGGVAQAECLLCKWKFWVQTPVPSKKKKGSESLNHIA